MSDHGRTPHARHKQRPRRERVPHRHQIVIHGGLVVERVDRAVDGLVKQQVVEILRTSVAPHHEEPQRAARRQNSPRPQAPVAAQRAQPPRHGEKRHGGEQRHQHPDGAFGEERREHENGKQRTVARRSAVGRGIYSPKCMQRQRDEHAHEHIHPQKYREAKEKAAGHEHHSAAETRPLVQRGTYPAVHGAQYHDRGHEREQRQKPHAVTAEEHLAQHDDPQIEGRFVGVGFALIGECEQMSVAQRLVGYAQVAQLVRRCEVAQHHHGQQCQQENVRQITESIFHCKRFFFRSKDCGCRPRSPPTARV